MAEPRRVFVVTFVLGVVVVYGAVAIEISGAHYSLVSDYIEMANMHAGFWPAAILKRLVNPFDAGAWIYRPFADVVSWLLGVILEHHVGAWHALLIAFRLISVGAAYAVARTISGTCAAIVAAAYFAFFPAIPEVDLTRVETYLILTLSLAFYGYVRLARGGSGVWLTALAFIAATMSKEVVAPLMVLLFAFFVPVLWRRGTAGGAALAAMALALLNDVVRFVLLFFEPYAVHRQGGMISALAHQGFWVAKVLLLATTNVAIMPLLLLVWFALGAYALWRDRAIAIGAMLLLSLAMAVIAPYPALRYLSPAAFFVVPLLAAGIEESRRRMPKAADVCAYASLVLFIVFGGAQLAAQAASMKNSTTADDQLLRYAAGALARGRDVVMIEDYDFERAFWVRAELAGIDPRYPFITYVGYQSARNLPIVWPKPVAAPVNLTGAVAANAAGRFATIRPPLHFVPGALVIPANPEIRTIAANAKPEMTFDARDDAMTHFLARFERFAHTTNPKFHFLFDLGEWPFPGSSWTVFAAQ